MESKYVSILSKYLRNLAALRDHTDLLNPIAEQTEQDAMIGFLAGLKTLNPDSPEDSLRNESIDETIEKIRSTGASISLSMAQEEGQESTTEEQAPVKGNRKKIMVRASPHVFVMWKNFELRRQSLSLLHRSGLINLISFFELFVADLFSEYYRLCPEALSSSEKTLSINDVKVFDTVAEIMEHVSAEKVEWLLHQSVETWAETMKKSPMKVDVVTATSKYWDLFLETYQRRNILVHNDGIVNKIYLNKVGEKYLASLKTPVTLGTKLGVTAQYLHTAIDLFTVVSLLWADIHWGKFADSQEANPRDALLMDVIYESLKAGRWDVAAALSNHGLSRESADQENHLIFQMNYWLAKKRLGQWKSIEAAIKKFDTRACHPTFALCVHSLREECEAATAILPIVIAAKSVNRNTIQEWPILEELRKNEEFMREVDKCCPEVASPGSDGGPAH